MAAVTTPLCFTGRKRRRLVCDIYGDPNRSLPPWGSWEAIAENPQAFTKLRRSVNRAIAPLEVDHIDFLATTRGSYGYAFNE
jgi:hypothetical protein